jgi:hypothetical protein
MFRLTAERRRVWKDLLLLEDDTPSMNEMICCRHFSLAQYNEIRLSRGCKLNILHHEALPDMNLPGRENSPDLVIYQEPYYNNNFCVIFLIILVKNSDKMLEC